MSQTLARTISVLGHPLVMLPLAVLLLSGMRAGEAGLMRMTLGLSMFAIVVIAWSWWQVRRGNWTHVDASSKRERRTLNRFLLFSLVLATLFSTWQQAPAPFVLGLALSAMLIAVAMVTSHWCKLSLHMAFAMYAALLLWQLHIGYGIATLAFSAAIAWSRLTLHRHTPADLVAGALAGLLAGIAFHMFASG